MNTHFFLLSLFLSFVLSFVSVARFFLTTTTSFVFFLLFLLSLFFQQQHKDLVQDFGAN
jgi:hypothetical protein